MCLKQKVRIVSTIILLVKKCPICYYHWNHLFYFLTWNPCQHWTNPTIDAPDPTMVSSIIFLSQESFEWFHSKLSFGQRRTYVDLRHMYLHSIRLDMWEKFLPSQYLAAFIVWPTIVHKNKFTFWIYIYSYLLSSGEHTGLFLNFPISL